LRALKIEISSIFYQNSNSNNQNKTKKKMIMKVIGIFLNK